MKTVILILICALVGCGRKGDPGDTGQNGQAGAIGAAGPRGADGTSVTPRQFCTAQSGSYPGSFPEYGLCINDELYAVFWSGGNSWLAKLYPGTYVSTATGLACTFTVAAHCMVHQ